MFRPTLLYQKPDSSMGFCPRIRNDGSRYIDVVLINYSDYDLRWD